MISAVILLVGLFLMIQLWGWIMCEPANLGYFMGTTAHWGDDNEFWIRGRGYNGQYVTRFCFIPLWRRGFRHSTMWHIGD